MWYLSSPYKLVWAANFDEMLADFRAQGMSDDVANYLIQQQGANKGLAVNYLKSNPAASLQDIQGHMFDSDLRSRVQREQQAKYNRLTQEEANIIALFPEPLRLWPQVQLRKLRLQPTTNGFNYRGFTGGTTEDENWNVQNAFQSIADWARYVMREDPNFQLSTFNFSQALARANDWHIAMANEESNLTYTPYKRNEQGDLEDERIVYTFPDGWHISQVTNRNDLKVEGNRMNHCFAPGAMVRTLDGFKQIEKIELGELVVCGDGTFRKVTKLFKQPYSGLMIRMGTRVGVDASLITPNHEFLSLKKLHGGEKHCQSHLCGKSSRYNEHEVHDVEWKSIGELSINSYLVTSYPLEYFNIDKIEVPTQYTGLRRKGSTTFSVDEQFLWMVGMFIAEGSAAKNKIQFAISKNETEYAEKLESFF